MADGSVAQEGMSTEGSTRTSVTLVGARLSYTLYKGSSLSAGVSLTRMLLARQNMSATALAAIKNELLM